jgi:hypothetical protein
MFRSVTESGFAYEERLTVWQAASADDAIALAEAEAARHATKGIEYAGLAQSYQLHGPLGQGVEVFSLIRDSALEIDDYLDTFFDTGAERQSQWGEA